MVMQKGRFAFSPEPLFFLVKWYPEKKAFTFSYVGFERVMFGEQCEVLYVECFLTLEAAQACIKEYSKEEQQSLKILVLTWYQMLSISELVRLCVHVTESNPSEVFYFDIRDSDQIEELVRLSIQYYPNFYPFQHF
jgi:hypothetical protein